MISALHPTPAIAVDKLIKHYPKATGNAVDDVSFSVKRGEIFGLLGPNGAGKTSTIGVLTTNVIPTSGVVRISDIDAVRDPIGVKQHISVVPQRSNLDQSLKAREILTFHASYHGIPKVERNARADKLLEEFGLTDRGNEKVTSYSGGMTQRLMIARALMHTPDILFLDEPTNNLDPQARLFLWERIRTLKQQGITVLLTTHDMEEANRLCDRIAIMDHGHILVCDTPTELQKIIPGGNTLEIRVALAAYISDQPEEAAPLPAATKLRQALEALPGITAVDQVPLPEDVHESNLAIFRVHTADITAITSQTLQVIADTGAELRSLQVTHPSLEDVFIHLTGRNLRS